MALVIKELVVKAEVEQKLAHSAAFTAKEPAQESLERKLLIDQCAEEVLRILDRRRER